MSSSQRTRISASHRPMPPMLSPTRVSILSPTRVSQPVPTVTSNTDESEADVKMKKLSKLVAQLHQRKQQEVEYGQKIVQTKVYSDLFKEEEKELSSAENELNSFMTYRDPKNKTREEFAFNYRSSSKNKENLNRDETFAQSVDQQLLQLERDRKIAVERAVFERKKRLDRFIENITAASLAQLHERLNAIRLEEDNLNKSLADDEEEAERRLQAEQKRLQEEDVKRERNRAARLQAAETAALAAAAKEEAIQAQFEEVQRREAEEEEQRRQQEEQKLQYLSDLKEQLFHFETTVMKTKDILDQSYLPQLLDNFGIDLSNINDIIDGADFDPDVVNGFISGLDEASKLLETQLEEIAEQQKRYEEKEREKAEQEAAERAAAKKSQEEAANVQQQQQQQPPQAIPTELNDQVSKANWDRYEVLIRNKQDFAKAVKPLLDNKDLKPFTFLCMKAVNTPVNAIGRATSSHLMDKINKLISLLRGQTVEVQDTQFSASAHPLGVAYCKTLLASKLLRQGEDVVRAQPKDAFTVAAVVVALWSEFPDFGDLFLAHLYERCPFLIPCHFAKKEGMSEQDYYKKLGYLYQDNQVEDQVTFESRMGGVGRLYAAIMVSTLPKDSLRAKKDHPHGIGNAWRWLTSCLNLKPVNGITTTLMVNMLEVCGHELFSRYKGQFRKLIMVLAQDYFNLIRRTSLEAARNRLEMILEKAITTGSIKQPDGILNAGFL